LLIALVAAGIGGPASALAAAPAPVSPSATAQASAPAPRLDASRLADRATPGTLALQPIIVAQQSGFSVRDISGPPDEPLPVEISLPPEDGDLFRVIMVRGLPQDFKLTAGVSLDDAWALSPSDLSRVELVAPPDYNGQFSMEVLFIRGNGEARDQKIVNVRIGPEPDREVTSSASEEPDQPKAEKPSLSPEMQKSMFDRAESMMAGGDIAGARLILEYLADHGVAGAAFAMGQSFDPGFLQDIYVRGGDPSNVEKAREWYRRAADMGNEDARSRLTVLER
jgi:TPR repeat protein